MDSDWGFKEKRVSSSFKRLVRMPGAAGEIQFNGSEVRFVRTLESAEPEAEADAAAEVLEAQASVEEIGAGRYSILIGGRSFLVTVDGAGGVSVDGRAVEVGVYDPRELAAGGAGGAQHGRLEITAPMPGKVIRLLVETGQEVAEGDGLIVVEAMKMQNEMKSAKAGNVVEVRVAENDTVAAGDVLLVIE